MSITIVQVAGDQIAVAVGCAGNCLEVTLSATTIGNLIVVTASNGNTATLTISDDKGNTYTPVTGINSVNLSAGQHAETDIAAWTVDAVGGVTKVRITTNAGGTSLFIAAGEYSSSNGWPATPIDKIAIGTYNTTRTSFSSGSSGTLSQASEVAIGFMPQINGNPGAITPGGGFTARFTSTFVDGRELYYTDQIVNATTALTFSATTSAVDGIAVLMTFMDNAASSGFFRPDEDFFIPQMITT